MRNENLGQTLCLIHSEVSEALEAVRKNKKANLIEFENTICKSRIVNQDPTYTGNITPEAAWNVHFKTYIKDTFEDEIADTFIRLMDLCGAFEIDIDKHIELKRRFNSLREFKHGKAF